MEGVMSVAHDFNFKVVEDATEALGSYYLEGEYSNNKAGTIGDFGAYSFNGNKIITTGGGGMLVAKDESQLGHARYLSTQAKDDPRFYVHNEIGYNYRMTNVQAAIGVAQLEELEKFIARKNANYCTYQNELSDCSTGRMLPFRSQTRSNKWFYSFVVNDEVEAKGVENVINFLAEQGIGTRPIWGLISEQKPYLGSESYQIERARWYKSRVINLPCSTSINNDEIAKVCVALKQIG
jgi:perosamine synthetase